MRSTLSSSRLYATSRVWLEPMPAALRHDGHVLELGQVGHLERLEVADRLLHLRLPAPVELVPVLEVVTRARHEQLGAAADLRLVRDRVGAHVDPAVEHAMVDPERGRHDEDPRVRLPEAQVRRVGGDEVEREHRLREVHPVAEPAPGLLRRAPLLAEERVVREHRLPALAALRHRHVERAREAPDLALRRSHPKNLLVSWCGPRLPAASFGRRACGVKAQSSRL